MLKLYHCTSARSFRPLWTLEEMSLPYELVMLPFPPRVFAKDYLAINPLGTIPTLFDSDMRMTESTGICHYLATRHGPSPLAIDVADPDYGRWLNWLYMSDATLTFPQTLVLRYSKLEPPERRLPQAAEDYKKWFLGRLRIVEQATGESDYLVAGRFTIADIAVGYALMLAEILGMAGDFGPNVAAYWTRLKQRPSYARALAVQAQAMADQKTPAGVTV
ncbi:MAG: glutathione S-transferase family protein [Methylobacteriaceae bacterium]|nr:glutathione S-transferase family protein [Methylobacteriaceae bacterium]